MTTLPSPAGTSPHPAIPPKSPRRLTPLAPSYWHGWSPDGKTLAYCADRNGNFDIYTMPVDGGPETRLSSYQLDLGLSRID